MALMDRSWMYKFRGSKEYENGLDKLLNIAFEKESVNGKIVCPCKNCKLGDWVDRVTTKDHFKISWFSEWVCKMVCSW